MFIQRAVGLMVPLMPLRVARPVLHGRLGDGVQTLFLFSAIVAWLLVLCAVFAGNVMYNLWPPGSTEPPAPVTGFRLLSAVFKSALSLIAFQILSGLVTDWIFWRSFESLPAKLESFQGAVRLRIAFQRTIVRLIGTLFVIGLSLLPLTALLIALPAVSPSEAVLSDTVRPARSWRHRTARRVFAVLAGIAVVVALLAFSIEVVARLPLPTGGQIGTLAKKVLSYAVTDFVPEDPKPALVEPLKEMLDRRDNQFKILAQSDIEPSVKEQAVADFADANSQIAAWADSEKYRWIVSAALWAERAAAIAGNKPDPVKKALVEQTIADRVSEVTRRWLPAEELLERRKAVRQAAARTILNPIDRTEANEKRAEVEEEIARRSPDSLALRIMLNTTFAPILAVPLWELLPATLIDQWPFVFLVMYGTDLLLLLLIGKVPLTYNFRYLWVRRRQTALTAVAFTVVVALVVVLLAFVNGMYKLNEATGVPGNVMVMSDGSTDELFSNLARSDGDNVERVVVIADSKGRPIGPDGKGVGIARGTIAADGKITRLPVDAPKDMPDAVYLASYESYLVMNQAIPRKGDETQRRRFLQLRAFQDVRIGSAVHNIDLEPGGRWFTGTGVEPGAKAPDGLEYLQCCIGEGAAATLGEDAGKARLAIGDTFELGERWWKVIGVMRTRGTTYGSEMWSGVENPVVRATGKGDKFTTLVLRMADDSNESGKAMAHYLNEGYTAAKLKAFSEPDYYKELTKTNEQFLTMIAMMAIIMAVGGIFGVMNTMFASIAARMKEVGVLRILGFKRWQILISFMVESLAIAFVGGVLGCLLGYFANGFEAASQLSGGQGGGKHVTLTMMVDMPIIATGLLFTLVMGRLGGLVPALSAMRMEILESLR